MKQWNPGTLANQSLVDWVQRMAQHLRPERVHWCDGSRDERDQLERLATESGSLLPLDPLEHPRSFLHRNDPSDVAALEQRTFVSTAAPERVGPTNRWMSSLEANERVYPLFRGAMEGRTMYVVPYLLGPVGSPYARVGVQITDCLSVVLGLRLATRMGSIALDHLGAKTQVVRGLHSLGDRAPERRFVVHFPDLDLIWSIGSGYGGNARLAGRCHALRIASAQARREGWLAEHASILGLTSPEGRTHYVAAALPSGCGKTSLAMLIPSLPGWKVDTVGDGVAWLHPGSDGRLWAINPENGVSTVASGTSAADVASLARDALFTDVGLRSRGRVYWEGLGALDEGEDVVDWRGRAWTASGAREPVAHPGARLDVPLRSCPSASGAFELTSGVPISAILFGGRRAKLAPLVYEARTFRHGVYVGATMVDEGADGAPRNDPMGMLPFCGYDMGEYFAHWLEIGRVLTRPPRIFHVNWFRTGHDGRYLWPGFGENVRVLEWILERVDGEARARDTAIGWMPDLDALDLRGLGLDARTTFELLAVDPAAWLQEAGRTLAFLGTFGRTLPAGLVAEHRFLVKRLHDSLH